MEDEDDVALSDLFKFLPKRTSPLDRQPSAYHRHRSASPKHRRSKSCNALEENEDEDKRSPPCRISRKGDFVWAKAFPYTWWPGQVECFNGPLVLVSFFGCNRTRLFYPSAIRGFEESYPQMVRRIGVKLSEEIDLALNEFAISNATGLKCFCGVSSMVENGSLTVKRGFNPLEILGFVIDKAMSPQVADEEIATIVRVSASLVTFRRTLSICKTSGVDELFCAEGLLDFVGDMAISPCTDDKETDGFHKAVAQLNAFRRFTSMKPDEFSHPSLEFKNDSLESDNVQAYLGQPDYTPEDEMCHEMTMNAEVDVSVESQEECELPEVNNGQDREMCVINMMDFSIFENYESQIYDHQWKSAGRGICRNIKHGNILHSCTEDISLKPEVGEKVQSYKNFALVKDTNETASSSICTSVHDNLVIEPPLNFPNYMPQVGDEVTFNRSIVANLENVKHESTGMPLFSDKCNSADVLSSAEIVIQQRVQLSGGQLQRLPINNVRTIFSGDKYECQIYDQHQVDSVREQSAGKGICRNTNYGNILHSCTEDATIKLEVGAEVQDYNNLPFVNVTNETAASSICASVYNKLVNIPPVGKEVAFNQSIVVNIENVKQESNDMPICKTLLRGEKYESQIYDQHQADAHWGQSAGRGVGRNTNHQKILHSCKDDALVKVEVRVEAQGYKNCSPVNDTNETAARSICASVPNKLVIMPPLTYPNHMLQVGEEVTFNSSMVANLEDVKHESTGMPIYHDKFNSIDVLFSAENTSQQIVHLLGGQLQRFPTNNGSAFLSGAKYESQIYDQHQVDADQGQSAGRDICQNTNHENRLNTCMVHAPVKLEIGEEVQGYQNISLVNDTNEIAASSICTSVHNKFVTMPPLAHPNHMLQVSDEVAFNISNLEDVEHKCTDIPVYSDKYTSAAVLYSAENPLQQAVHLSEGQLHGFPVNNGSALSPSNLNLANRPQSRAEICSNIRNVAQCVNEIPQVAPLEKTALQSLANKRKRYETTTENYKSLQTPPSCSETASPSGSLMRKIYPAKVNNGNNKTLSQDNFGTDGIKLGFSNQQRISKVRNGSFDVNVSCKLNNSERVSKEFSTSHQHNHHHQSKWQVFYATPLIKDGLPSTGNRLNSFDSNNCSTPKNSLTVKFSKDSNNCCTPKKKLTVKFPKDNKNCSTPKKKLTMKFPKNYTLPSKADLEKKFRVFGPLDHGKTEVFFYTGVGQVVFLHQVDAVVAYNYVTKKGIFGQANMRFWLSKAEDNKKEKTSIPGDVRSSLNVKPCLKKSNVPPLIERRKNQRVRFSSDR